MPERPRSTFYENCDAVRAAGAAPLHRDDPGYRPALDRDNDGIACEPEPAAKPEPRPRPAQPAPEPTVYENCDAVRAAGAAPLHRDEPGYRPALDRDNDGIACEPERPTKPEPSPTPEPTPEPEPAPQPEPEPEPEATFYENCDAAREAGAAPLHEGDPGYRPALDRDGDGIACEPK